MLELNGKILSNQIEAELKERVSKVKGELGFTPTLAVIMIGYDKASETYVKMKKRACERIGLDCDLFLFDDNANTESIKETIEKINETNSYCGIMVQHPAPKHIDEHELWDSILPSKDVDGLNAESFGRMSMGLDSYKCATPLGIMTILEHYNVPIEGKNVVIVGRSPILGKPLAMMMLNENATVTICHSKTVDLPNITKQADIVVACVGKKHFIKPDWIKEGVVLVDAGYNEGNTGDIDPECWNKSSAYTPVPNGVGAMTICSLLMQTVESAEKMLDKRCI